MKDSFRNRGWWFAAAAFAVVGLLVMCSGCTPPMSNEAIIAETKKCEAAGLRAVGLASMSSGDRIFAVECIPK